jgi:hypothetical protein
MATDVTKMIDDIINEDTSPAGGTPGGKPADANALLDAATRPDGQPATPPAGATPPKTETGVDPTKFGQLLNENADLKKQMDTMRADMAAMKERTSVLAAPPKPVDAQDDGGWGKWATTKVAEVDDATWMANPKAAVEKVLATAGRELTEHSGKLATSKAWEVGTAMRLDAEFTEQYPDLMATDLGKQAVQTAVGQVVADRRFQDLMKSHTTRHKALAVVAQLANQSLGRNDTLDPALFNNSPAPARKAVFAERSAGRPGGGPQIDQDRNTQAMQSVIDHARAHS